MQKTWERQTAPDHTFRAAMLGFIVVVLGAVGFVFFMNEKHVREQKALYAEYLAMNSWRAPARAGYARVAPIMDEIERIDPMKQVGSKELIPIAARSRAAWGPLKKLSSGTSGKGMLFSRKRDNIREALKWFYSELYLACAFQELPRNRQYAYEEVASYKATDWFRKHPLKNGNYTDYAAKVKQFTKEVKKESDTQIRQELKSGLKEYREPLDSSRRDFERLLDTAEDLPDGLDLRFATSLK